MCLPFLESAALTAEAAGRTSRPPVRMAALYMPNGGNPQLAFDRLFCSHASRDGARSAHDASVLDVVMEDAKSLQSRVGGADRLKLDEYFDAVRSVEKRIQFDAARRKGEYEGDPHASR